MKTIKALLCTSVAIATLALCASSTRAQTIIGTTTNYSMLNVALTVATNSPSVVKGGTDIYNIGKAKANNKILLKLFANWSTNTFPAGAKLVVGWDSPWSGDVLVVDKSGTNVYFDATTGAGGGSAYFSVDFYDEDGAYTESYLDATPGHYNYSYPLNGGYFELYDDNYYLPYTDIYAYTAASSSYFGSWTSTTEKWSEHSKMSTMGYGDNYFFDYYGSSGPDTISTSGHGLGYNPYFD
jgi:hypothetical protein